MDNQEKYKNKFRIPSARLNGYDYSQSAAYFITICTKNRENFFGEIQNQKMAYTEIGEIAKKYWSEIPNHFPFVILGEYVIMPDHMHGILIFDKTDEKSTRKRQEFGPQSQNLAAVIRGYKSGVTQYIQQNPNNVETQYLASHESYGFTHTNHPKPIIRINPIGRY